MDTSEHVIAVTSISSAIPSEVHELSQTAIKIALQNYDWRFITLVYFNTTTWLGAEYFLQSYKKVVVIGRGLFYPKHVESISQYVLFENGMNNIVDTLNWMRSHQFDNTGKYIIVCQTLNEYECDETAAMHTFWEHKITNVILLKSVENQATGFTYYPLNDHNCFYHTPVELVNLTSCLDTLDSRESCNLFPMKLDNFNMCPLTVSTFLQQPYMGIENGKPKGSDGDLVGLLAEKLNANLIVITPRIGEGWGKLEKNGSWSGSLADIYYDYANFSITSAALTLARFSCFQLSNVYNAASVVWVTHSAKIIPASLKLTYPFQQDAQIALVISFAVVVICAIILRSRFWFRMSRKLKWERPSSGIVFHSWMVCMGLGLPSTRMPTKTAILYILILWIWYSVLVRTFYQVSLITAMKATYYYQDPESIEDVIEADYPFGGGAALKDYFIDYPMVYNRWTDVQTLDIIPTLRNVSKGMDFVVAMNMETAKTLIWNEKLDVHILSQRVVTSPTVIFFKKYSPLIDAVNSVLARLIESGFSDKLYKQYSTRKYTHKSINTIESIKLDHYTGCYVLLIAGWIASYLLFVAEIVFDKIYRQKNRQAFGHYLMEGDDVAKDYNSISRWPVKYIFLMGPYFMTFRE